MDFRESKSCPTFVRLLGYPGANSNKNFNPDFDQLLSSYFSRFSVWNMAQNGTKVGQYWTYVDKNWARLGQPKTNVSQKLVKRQK